ncbi:hypothetical protein KCG43_20350 [Photobacterium sp. WH24]|uniref:hypothetical protein n=1 Tax=Photobacterium sp. WH24 TaxID=2827237 RepID=UPI001C490F67|nr:hypothetical protein [Photobacterium sp. WH24]MBV7264366.1 hypothetical protein [Photobacterium sp. WH24]
MGKRILISRTLQLSTGTKLTRDLGEFTPPTFAPRYEDVEGTFVGGKDIVGFDAGEFSIPIKGESASILMGTVTLGRAGVVIYKEKYSENGKRSESIHTMTAECVVERSPTQTGKKAEITLKGTVNKYAFMDDGVPITTVDIDNSDYFIEGRLFNI